MICIPTFNALGFLFIYTLIIGFWCYMIGKEVQKSETDRWNKK